MSKLAWFSTILFGINMLSGIALIISLSSAYISPEQWILPSLAGLAFVQIFVINLVFFFIWLFFNRKYVIYSAVFLVFGFTELPNHFQLNFPDDPEGKPSKILSLNVRNFDLYNWTSNKKTRNKILQVIKSKNANIICLQEFFNTTDKAHDFKTLDTIMQFNKELSSHVEYTATVKGTENWGIATFTTYPVVGQGVIRFEESSNNICIYTDVNIGWKTFRVYNVHLASLHFGKEDYNYLANVVDRKSDPNMEGNKNLLNKMNVAYKKRAAQVDQIRAHMNNSPYPIILCGDFNDTPTSYAYNELVKGLSDSFKEKGNGFGSTYNGKLPYLRIDYILTDHSVKILKHEVIRGDISDHYPVCISFKLRKD